MDMDSIQSQSQQVIRLLAQGINPVTGEVLPNTSPYNEPVVIRALFATLEHVRIPSKPRREKEMPAMHGQPWSPEDRERLAAAFMTGESEARLAEAFQRTPGGIRAELLRQGLIEENPSASH